MSGPEADKSRLAIAIFSISRRVIWCAHSRNHDHRRQPFIDWYHILGVDENAGTDKIRKTYHRLALQLHPDKNKHPKAEFAFKLVSEAYTCLLDTSKRKAFDSEKSRNFCWECNRIPYTASAPGNPDPTMCPKSRRSFRGLDEIKDRFREEARVIENCLRANTAMRRDLPHFINDSSCSGDVFRAKLEGNGARKESPVFDPAHYIFNGYPHIRTRVTNAKVEALWGASATINNGRVKCEERIGKKVSDSPVFLGSVARERLTRSRSSCIRS